MEATEPWSIFDRTLLSSQSWAHPQASGTPHMSLSLRGAQSNGNTEGFTPHAYILSHLQQILQQSPRQNWGVGGDWGGC